MPDNPLRQAPLFATLPDDELQEVAASMRRVDAPAGALLFREGEPGDRFSVIIAGEVEVVKALGTPDERVLAVATSGDFMGEMSLLFSGGRRSASGRVRAAATLLEMTRADFDALLARRPALAGGIMRELIERLRANENATIRDLRAKNEQLTRAYAELQAAQARLIEQETLQNELRLARQIQQNFLPQRLPELPGWRVNAHWQPARAVSGDFYDFIPYPDGRWGIVTGDATGKSVPAALVMATTTSMLQIATEQASSPGAILGRVNNLLCATTPPNMFVTCLHLVLDPASGAVRFANAGHNLPFQRVANAVSEPRATGMPLGLMPDMPYEERETILPPGGVLLLYSDGLVEAHNPQGEMFGFPRLRELVASHGHSPSLIPALLADLAAFVGPDWEQEDDVTLVTLERL